ncbi:cobalamin biosynthesis protein CbiX [Paenibacillus pasadenensis]|uniref:sirohydrochlorin chelatase n=1 Tax=Paenibacillus pasadenensis TaxID=217090 RepID=UPI00204202AF|nr:CbiX/SirB N-terminal domain-containing protein [Paenibacillus pasadenensis]MCM3749285.1 cobalamin biosynthesis protein CbiX [Paenibacillus pasadenensis]
MMPQGRSRVEPGHGKARKAADKPDRNRDSDEVAVEVVHTIEPSSNRSLCESSFEHASGSISHTLYNEQESNKESVGGESVSGILVISHGSRDPQWVSLVDEAVGKATAMISNLTGPVPVISSFLELVTGRLIQDGIDELLALGVTDIYVLPLFVSSGSTHVDDIMQAFGQPPVGEREGELEAFYIEEACIHPGKPIDDEPEIAELLLRQVLEQSLHPAGEALLLIGHGSVEPVFHERWQEGLGRMAERLRLGGGFARADYAMLLPDQAAAKLGELQRERPEERIIVVPVFLSQGYFTSTVIPGRLGEVDYEYVNRAMLPDEAVARWIARQAKQWLDRSGG